MSDIIVIILLAILAISLPTGIFIFLKKNKSKEVKEERNEDINIRYLEDRIGELTDSNEQWKDEFENLTTSFEAIDDHNREIMEILQGQEVSVECPCGKGGFIGVFVPNQDNLVKCEKCEENINITFTTHTSVMPSDKTPDQIFDEISAINSEGGEENE